MFPYQHVILIILISMFCMIWPFDSIIDMWRPRSAQIEIQGPFKAHGKLSGPQIFCCSARMLCGPIGTILLLWSTQHMGKLVSLRSAFLSSKWYACCLKKKYFYLAYCIWPCSAVFRRPFRLDESSVTNLHNVN
jgi:hypothetical protein